MGTQRGPHLCIFLQTISCFFSLQTSKPNVLSTNALTARYTAGGHIYGKLSNVYTYIFCGIWHYAMFKSKCQTEIWDKWKRSLHIETNGTPISFGGIKEQKFKHAFITKKINYYKIMSDIFSVKEVSFCTVLRTVPKLSSHIRDKTHITEFALNHNLYITVTKSYMPNSSIQKQQQSPSFNITGMSAH